MGLAAGCGGSGKTSTAASGTFSLSLTDGPVDDATKVIVELTGVFIKPANGDPIVFEFNDARRIDLLELQGSASESLVTGESIPAGVYE